MPRILVATVAAVVVAVMAAPAQGAVGARNKPTALSIFAKGHAATPSNRSGVQAQDEGDGDHVDADEAESVKLRGEFEQSIVAAPAVAAPAAGLVAAQQRWRGPAGRRRGVGRGHRQAVPERPGRPRRQLRRRLG